MKTRLDQFEKLLIVLAVLLTVLLVIASRSHGQSFRSAAKSSHVHKTDPTEPSQTSSNGGVVYAWTENIDAGYQLLLSFDGVNWLDMGTHQGETNTNSRTARRHFYCQACPTNQPVYFRVKPL